MRVRGQLVTALQGADLLGLIDGKVPESQELEYKRELPAWTGEGKREFLADVSSFANTSGGVLLYGVATSRDEQGRDSGIPESIASIPSTFGEFDALRLSQILHDGLSPRLTGDVIRIIEAPGGERVLVIGVRRSLLAPHMVWLERSGKVWARKGAHKDQVDAVELRRMFLESSDWVDQAEAFRAARVEPAIKNSQALDYHRPQDAGRALLHILPLGRLRRRLDLRPHEAALRDHGIALLRGGADPRYNFDGYLLPGGGTRQWKPAVQWFRSGAVELADSRFHNVGHDNTRVFSADQLTRFLPGILHRVIDFMATTLESEPPLGIGLSIVGLSNTRLADLGYCTDARPFDTPSLIIPFEVIEDVDKISTAATRILEVVWQSANVPNIPNLPAG